MDFLTLWVWEKGPCTLAWLTEIVEERRECMFIIEYATSNITVRIE